ncbi:MAG: DUF2157 domain-containing protein [Hyphomonadaceae bacterium]|nr:DUF2157 domain-containing protein [Hyphomonadaceae bacterium]
MAYRRRLEQDLDRWIAAGHVAGDKRAAILAMVRDGPRIDAATALAFVGAVMLGLAMVAFIAANWDGMARLARLCLVLAAFALAIGGAAWAAGKARPMLSNALSTIAALVFAAGVGLVGQIFDIAGKPGHALIGAGVGAALIAGAGRSTGAAVLSLALLGIGDATAMGDGLWWLLAASALAGLAAWSWRSPALAQAASLALLIGVGWLCARSDAQAAWFLAAALGAAGAAYLARGRDDGAEGVFSTAYGWAVWGALIYLVAAGVSGGVTGAAMIPHRLVWLAAAGGAIALGRHDRHAMVTTAGVLFLIGAVMALLVDLGVDLIAAAGLFFVCALAAMIAGLLLRRAAKEKAP